MYRGRMGQKHQTPFIGEAQTHRQHYVPQFFLREFTKDRKRFAVLDNGQVQRNVKTSEICYLPDLYETRADPEDSSSMMIDPNAIESTLRIFEARIAPQYRDILEEIITMRPSDGNSEQIGRICDISSLLVAFLIARSPEYLSKTVPEQRRSILEYMRQHGLGTPEELTRLLSETTGEDTGDRPLLPEQIADHLAKLFTVVPFAADAADSSAMMEMAQTLRNEYSFLFPTTCENHPFIGLSAPYITADGTGPTLVFPLSSRVCMICTADGQHTFRKQSINNRELRMMNRLLLSADINGFKFCEREDYLHSMQ